jgi:hypothetical protein
MYLGMIYQLFYSEIQYNLLYWNVAKSAIYKKR